MGVVGQQVPTLHGKINRLSIDSEQECTALHAQINHLSID